MAVHTDIISEIHHYAKRHLESSKQLYNQRNQNPKAMFKNIFQGKLAEWYAYFQLVNHGYILDKPDMLIYKTLKSHDADLVIKGKDNLIFMQTKQLHVKSVSLYTQKTIGMSFLVERTNPLVNHPNKNHFYLVMKEVSDNQFHFHTFLSSLDAVYRKPKKKLSTKLAIYL